MTLAIDTVGGLGLSNEACCELLPKKSKVMLCYLFIQLYITNKTEHFSFKSEHAMWVAKLVKEDCSVT